MNPFNNNVPNLTASEVIRNKRDKIIFKTEKKRFQTKSKCNNKNVKYYKNGKIRNMHSYKIQQSLARGNALCNDCNNKGMLCGFNSTNSRIKSLSKFTTVNMGNNTLSEFWGHGGWNLAGDPFPIQSPGIPIINSDISGTWAGLPTDPNNKHNITHVNTIPAPFGYADNIIDSNRNRYGNGIITDPSNILLSAGMRLPKFCRHPTRSHEFPRRLGCEIDRLVDQFVNQVCRCTRGQYRLIGKDVKLSFHLTPSKENRRQQ